MIASKCESGGCGQLQRSVSNRANKTNTCDTIKPMKKSVSFRPIADILSEKKSLEIISNALRYSSGKQGAKNVYQQSKN